MTSAQQTATGNCQSFRIRQCAFGITDCYSACVCGSATGRSLFAPPFREATACILQSGYPEISVFDLNDRNQNKGGMSPPPRVAESRIRAILKGNTASALEWHRRRLLGDGWRVSRRRVASTYRPWRVRMKSLWMSRTPDDGFE